MANRQKYVRGGIGHLFAHYERGKDKDGNYVQFGNQDIDTSKSHLNYNLAAQDQPLSQNDFLHKRMNEVYCLNRKNVNVMMSWVVSLPEGMNEKPIEEQKRFFNETYDFLKKRYGKENVISAWVHLDESGQPHMHFAYTPVCYDKKKERYSFNAKVVGSKSDLNSFHKDLDKTLIEKLGYETGVRTGETEINLTIKQLKDLSRRQAKIERKLKKVSLDMPKVTLGHVKADEVQKIVESNKTLNKALLLANEQIEAQKRVISLLENDRDWKKYKKLEKAYKSLETNYKALKSRFDSFYNRVNTFMQKFNLVDRYNEFSQIEKELNQADTMAKRIALATKKKEFDEKYGLAPKTERKIPRKTLSQER